MIDSADSSDKSKPKSQDSGSKTPVLDNFSRDLIKSAEEGKLDPAWESYNLDGTRKCLATYNYGVKIGTWTYWNDNKVTKIEYDNNKVVKIEEFEVKDLPKTSY